MAYSGQENHAPPELCDTDTVLKIINLHSGNTRNRINPCNSDDIAFRHMPWALNAERTQKG